MPQVEAQYGQLCEAVRSLFGLVPSMPVELSLALAYADRRSPLLTRPTRYLLLCAQVENTLKLLLCAL